MTEAIQSAEAVVLGEQPAASAQQPQGERPAWLPEKFKSPEDLAKAYQQLEGKLGKPKAAEAAPEAPADLQVPEKPAAPEVPANAQPALQALIEEAQAGEVSEATYKSWAGRGLSKAEVDAMVAGQKAAAAQAVAPVIEALGGQEAIKDTLRWASENLSESEIAEANAELRAAKSPTAVRLILQGLMAQRQAAEGDSPTGLLKGAGAARSGAEPFPTKSDMVKAVSDKRYQQDSNYRRMVEARIAATEPRVIQGV